MGTVAVPTSREKAFTLLKKGFLVRYMMSSSASSPSIIAQLSAVGSSHSLPLELITSLEYLYCNLQHKAGVIVLLSAASFKWMKIHVVLLARLLPEIAADADQQHGSYRSSGNAKFEPEIQRHARADYGLRQRLSSVALQWLLPHIGGSLKENMLVNSV